MIKQCAKCIYYAGRNKDHIYCTKKGNISIIEDSDSVMCMDSRAQKADTEQCNGCYYNQGYIGGFVKCAVKGAISNSSDPFSTCERYEPKNEQEFEMPRSGSYLRLENGSFTTETKEELNIYDLIEQLTCNLGGAHSCWVGNAIKHIYNYNQSQTLSELEAAIEVLQEYVDTIRGR